MAYRILRGSTVRQQALPEDVVHEDVRDELAAAVNGGHRGRSHSGHDDVEDEALGRALGRDAATEMVGEEERAHEGEAGSICGDVIMSEEGIKHGAQHIAGESRTGVGEGEICLLYTSRCV